MSKQLTRSEILDTPFDRCPLKVEIPERDGHVFVCRITAQEREQWEKVFTGTDDNDPNTRGSFVWLTLCDETGERLFVGEDKQIAPFAQKDALFVSRIFKAAIKHNGMATEFGEETAKNSETTPENSSGSDSPDT